jgi:hypothetical protein
MSFVKPRLLQPCRVGGGSGTSPGMESWFCLKFMGSGALVRESIAERGGLVEGGHFFHGQGISVLLTSLDPDSIINTKSIMIGELGFPAERATRIRRPAEPDLDNASEGKEIQKQICRPFSGRQFFLGLESCPWRNEGKGVERGRITF